MGDKSPKAKARAKKQQQEIRSRNEKRATPQVKSQRPTEEETTGQRGP